MVKLGKFDEAKVKLVMKLRKMSRREAIRALSLDRKGERENVTHPERAAERMLDVKEFFRSIEEDGELIPAKEFRGDI